MRNPFRSERDAFFAALALAILTAVAALVGGLGSRTAGYVIFAVGIGAATGALVMLGRREQPEPLRSAAAEGPHDRDRRRTHRVLVIANESLEGDELRRELMTRVELWPELFVVAPVLASRAHRWADDVDSEREQAMARLDETLAWAALHGLSARGTVGDADPVVAVADALRSFEADEVVVATHPPGRSAWVEQRVVERVRGELDVPVTHVVVDLGRDLAGAR
ncbi:MAG: universal stress protein [Thermoleophilia bacterium]|nr:universal stress protein [Thermoleophilia bacterium]